MKKGFTLIELLGVIVVLAIIAVITVVSVSTTLNQSKKSLSESQINNIEEAAKSYYIAEGMSKNDNCISVSELINLGYIEGEKVLDPKTKKELTGYVKITEKANQFIYEYKTVSCEVIDPTIEE